MMEKLGMYLREVGCGKDGGEVRYANTREGFSVAGMTKD
jgi:hypothetical protein